VNRDLVLTALDVLVANIYGRRVEPRHINKIRRQSPAEQDLPIDELCSSIIERELMSANKRKTAADNSTQSHFRFELLRSTNPWPKLASGGKRDRSS